jgi:predicted pyridoxine 5'-phosphate oxidase superfamily flavin-nucleotide-binding protein
MAYASDIAFTDSVKAIQTERGSRAAYARMEKTRGGFATAISAEAAAYVAERDSAYFATANLQGQPYVQHRGGAPGFLHVLDPNTIAFADLVGNKQYITTGNLADNPRAFMFLMDYAAARRLKLWGRAETTRDPALLARLSPPGARVEQAIVFHVEALDWNCPQHIPALVHVEAVEAKVRALEARIVQLEEDLRAARAGADNA